MVTLPLLFTMLLRLATLLGTCYVLYYYYHKNLHPNKLIRTRIADNFIFALYFSLEPIYLFLNFGSLNFAGKFKPVIKKAMVELEGNT